MTVAPGPQRMDMLRRLRARPRSSFDHGDRRACARRAIQELADVAADATGHPRREVPDLGDGAIADQIAVLAGDADQAGAEPAVEKILTRLAAELGLRG